MPRYPAIRRYNKVNINLSGVASAAGGNPQPVTTGNEINSSAEAETLENAGNVRGTQASKYPTYKEPGFFNRMVNPQGAERINEMNYKSQFQTAADQAEMEKIDKQTQSQIAVKDHELSMQALDKVLERQGLTPEQRQQVIGATSAEKINQSKLGALQSQRELQTATQKPELLDQNYVAGLQKQDINNQYIKAEADTKNSALPFVPQKESAAVDLSEAQTRAMNNETEFKTLARPSLLQKARNDAVLHMPGGAIYGNVPTTNQEGNAINMYATTPEVHAQPAQSYLADDPSNPGKTRLVNQSPIPAQAPSVQAMGTMDNLLPTRPSANNQNPSDDIITLNGPDGPRILRRKQSTTQ